jgi:hypothetical protein
MKLFDALNDYEINRKLNDKNDPAYIAASKYMDSLEKKYQRENPCPECGSHNTHLDLNYISGAHSGWSEYCDDCGWKKTTTS